MPAWKRPSPLVQVHVLLTRQVTDLAYFSVCLYQRAAHVVSHLDRISMSLYQNGGTLPSEVSTVCTETGRLATLTTLVDGRR